MKAKLIMTVAMAAACAAIQLAAMPTEEEARRAEPVVKKMLAQERAALESGKKTRSEVAAAAMKLAGEADSDAAKLLLMKGAFALYVKDGNLEKAVETMKTLEAAISDMPPQSVTNMIEMALLGVSKKVDGARLYKLLDETKADIPSYSDLPSHVESKAIAASVKERSSVASILKSMIKLPGRDCWLSATEVTQGQWESVMGYNPSSHKGADLPVENVSRDDCDIFLKKLNATKEVQASQFEFRLPSYEEWVCAAGAGSPGNNFWIKPGVAGSWRRLDMAWLQDNSSNQTHVVATKAPNAFGFYDMLGNVWEWTTGCHAAGQEYARGGSFDYHSGIGTYRWRRVRRSYRSGAIGLRLAAYTRSKTSSDVCGKAGSSESDVAQRQETVDGYTWSYRVKKGEAMIVTANGRCAVSPSPKGAVSIPSTLGGVKVTSIGYNAFRNCRGLTSVTIPSGVASIGSAAFGDCAELMNVTIPESLRNIGEWAFSGCFALKSVTIPPNVERIGGGAFINCRGLTSVTIPAKVASIGVAAFSYCSALKQINVDASNQTFTSIDGVLYTKDRSVLIAFPNALTSVEMPKSVTNIGWCAFEGCSGLKSVTIPEGVDSIESGAFKECGGLVSVTIPSSVKIIGAEAFMNCKGLKSVTLPEGLSEIWGSAFWGCGELASLTLPKGLTTIGDNAFRGLGKLTTVTIPAEVTSIGGSVFSYCGGLTQINVEAGNQKYTSVDGVLYTKDLTGLVMCPNGLTSVTIPESVTSIGPGAFIGCGKLTSVMLPSGVSHIREWAFEACNGLTSVTIPESVTKIDRYAFLNCGGLTSLTMRGERPDAPNNIFQGCGKLKSIHVPANAKSWAGMKKWHGIPLVFDGEDAGRQAQVEHRAAPKGGLARLRQRRMEAERQAAESAQRQAAAEREQQLKALLQIQEELRRQREAKQAEKEAGVSGIQTKKFPLAQGLELEMIKCPAGEFMMGYESWKTWASSQNRQLRKLHRVKLTKDFMLGKFPVTCSQWYAIMGNGKKVPKGLENTPAGNITVPEMQAFCDKLTAKFKAQLGGKVFRLPTDAEWEYASKGGKNLDGMLGKTLGLNGNTGSSSRDGKEVEAIFRQMGYTAEDHARASDTNKPFFMWKPLAVGKYKPNEWGFMDLTGNAWEVTADTIMDTVLSKEGGVSSFIHVWNGRQRYADFEIDPLLKGERHLVRTGFWEKGIAHGIGNKMGIGDNDRFPAVGFRVCIGEPLGDWNNAPTTTSNLVENAFSLNAAPGSVTELNLGNVPPLQFVYCPAGKFSMGYKEHPAISKVKDIEITSPFWVSKTVIRADQLEPLGIISSITNAQNGAAVITDASIVVQKLPSTLKDRFGKLLPPGYVFRLPTEAEFEYLQKAETKDGDAPTNIWGVEGLCSGGSASTWNGYIGLLDRAPAYGRGVDVVNRKSRGSVWTDLVKVNYENQPDKDPVGWSDDPNWSVFRRKLARNCGGGKLITSQRTNKLYGFYFVVAPDVDKLNKFYWK